MFGWFKREARQQAAAVAAAAPRATLDAAELAAALRLAEADRARGDRASEIARLQELADSNPDEVKVLFPLGVCLYEGGDAAATVELMRRVLEREPQHLKARVYLAGGLSGLGDLAGATGTAQDALKAAPDDVDLLTLFANLCIRQGAFREAARHLNRACEIKPDALGPMRQFEVLSLQSTVHRSRFEASPRIREARRRLVNRLQAEKRKHGLNPDKLAALIGFLGGDADTFAAATKLAVEAADRDDISTDLAEQLTAVLWYAGDAARFEQVARRDFERDPENVVHRAHLANAWLVTGSEDWRTAMRMFNRVLFEERPHLHPQHVPLWEGEKPGRRKLLVYQDQGVGDVLMCLRFLPLLEARGIDYFVSVQPNLWDLVACVAGKQRVVRTTERADPSSYGCELAVPFFGLASALYVGLDEMAHPPILVPDPRQAPSLRAAVRALPGVRLGLVYGGNPDRRDDWMRSLPAGALDALKAVEGVSWVNLLFDPREDRAQAIATLGMFDPMPEVTSFADSAAVVQELDAVVAVDSSAAHVACALGKPTWVLVPSALDWRWEAAGRASPWWPTARVLRSEAPGQWTTVWEPLLAGLRELVAARRAPDRA